MRVKVVGVGGSLRAESTSRTALQAALDGVASSGAEVQLIWVRDLALPFYTAERAIPAAAHQFADTTYDCDRMIWSSPTYHGSVSGSFKNHHPKGVETCSSGERPDRRISRSGDFQRI
jgi:FMN reductase